MKSIRRKLLGLLATAAIAAAWVVAAPGAALAADGATCQGGSVAGGSYSSLTITGVCAVNAGNVEVRGNLTVKRGAVLAAVFSGSNLKVGRNLSVQKGAILILGCEPFAFPCANDPDAQTGGTLSASGSVGGNLTAENALAVLVHNTSIGRNLELEGGGGGVSCVPNPILTSIAGFPAPPYATFEDVSIRGSASISEWQSCWLGFFRNTVGNNVNFNENVTADPDGNEVATNTIQGNLNCEKNSPAPQIGDSGGSLNSVAGHARGQCAALAVHPA